MIISATTLSSPIVKYVKRLYELLIDLLSQIPTRKFLRVFLEDSHLILISRKFLTISKFSSRADYDLIVKLLTTLDNYIHFEVGK